jgi:hypothetical protein
MDMAIGPCGGAAMGWIEEREAMRYQIRELIHHADKCLDDFDGTPLVNGLPLTPLSVLSMSKALEYASRTASTLSDIYLSESKERLQNGKS